MMYLKAVAKNLVLFTTCLILISCSGDEVTGTGLNDVHGTAVDTGKLTNNDVVLRDKTGTNVTVTTDEQGAFNIDVTELTPPYLIKTETGSGPLYSIANSNGVANISPLSDIAVRNWFSVNGSDIDNVFASQDANLQLPSANDINRLVAAISNLISTVYTSFNLSTNYDFIHDEISSDFISMLGNTTIILANNELSITIETPTQQSISILIAFNFSDDLSSDNAIAPSQPQGLSATSSIDAVQLLWNVSRDNIGVDFYNIYRSGQINGTYAFLADSIVAHYSDTGLTSGIQHCYQVEAVDASGQVSPRSAPYCATTSSAPQNPGGVCGNSAGNFPVSMGESIELSTYWATEVDPNDSSAVYNWSLDIKPDESQLVLGQLDLQTASFIFIPDVIGSYRISLTMTADSISCTGAGGTWDIQVVAPIEAVAGPDLSGNLGFEVLLDGSASSGPVSQGFLIGDWSIVDGPAGYFPVINQTSETQASYIPQAPGIYEIQLLVRNGENKSATDSLILTVPQPEGSNLLPIANGGADRTISIGTTVTLDSSGSYDPNDSTATIVGSWNMYAVPPSSLDPGALTYVNETQTSFTPTSFGEYIMELSVHNSINDSYPYYVTITVTQ